MIFRKEENKRSSYFCAFKPYILQDKGPYDKVFLLSNECFSCSVRKLCFQNLFISLPRPFRFKSKINCHLLMHRAATIIF